MLSLIAALANNNVIGIKDTIPWYLPDDLIWFKKHTLHKPIIMGRCTWESIGKKPLPGRYNIIVSKSYRLNYFNKSKNKMIVVSSIKEALYIAQKIYNPYKEIMVIGGGKIYSQMLQYATLLYLTRINYEIIGDTYFPHIYKEQWSSIFRSYQNKNYYFEILERIV
ncbi:MAG: dihydrofolate reductase [Candidatus Dasytiphilus stammeri]